MGWFRFIWIIILTIPYGVWTFLTITDIIKYIKCEHKRFDCLEDYAVTWICFHIAILLVFVFIGSLVYWLIYNGYAGR